MKKLILLLLLATQSFFANNLTITNVTKVDNDHISFDVSWDNSWRVSGFIDAAWIFVKYKNTSGQWQHLDIVSKTASGFSFGIAQDNKGVILHKGSSGTGTANGSVTLEFDGSSLGPFPDFKVFGIEMVKINQGAFYVGDGDGVSSTFHQGNSVNTPYQIQNGYQITVGNTANDLAATGLSQNIPTAYPKGYYTFYMMKYEITQEQYVEFLNTLTIQQQQERTESDLTNITSSSRFVMINNYIPSYRNGIACDSNVTSGIPIHFYCDLNNNGIENESNDGQNLACNFLSTPDALAYLDWACMRPPTEFEYEKVCRGTSIPVINEYANGATNYTLKGSVSNPGMSNESYSNIGAPNGLINTSILYPIRVGGFATSTTTRVQSGAGFYGSMELSGNAGELCVSAASVNYTGVLGDGVLDSNGNANNWNSFSGLMQRGLTDKKVSFRPNYLIYINDNIREFQNIRGCRKIYN